MAGETFPDSTPDSTTTPQASPTGNTSEQPHEGIIGKLKTLLHVSGREIRIKPTVHRVDRTKLQGQTPQEEPTQP